MKLRPRKASKKKAGTCSRKLLLMLMLKILDLIAFLAVMEGRLWRSQMEKSSKCRVEYHSPKHNPGKCDCATISLIFRMQIGAHGASWAGSATSLIFGVMDPTGRYPYLL